MHMATGSIQGVDIY